MLSRWLDENRALIMLAALFAVFSLFAPNFFSVLNTTTILKGASLNAIVAIGFTIIFILGQLDLSIGAVVMLAGMLVIGEQPRLGWPGAMLLALSCGAAVGLVNGLLVVKAKINSFIVTLGTMTIVLGLMHLYSDGGSKVISDFRFADWLETPMIPFVPPIVAISVVLVLAAHLFLTRTTIGRSFFLVGGNAESAWLAGLNRDRYLLAGFVVCGLTAATGGVLFAAGLSSMTSAAVLGTRVLMTVLAAVIIGGTLMSGGRGSVLKSYFAVLMLTTLFNGLGCFGLGFEVQIFINGLILAAVVLYEASVIHRRESLMGQRPDLMIEARELRARPAAAGEGDEEMTDKDRFALSAIAMVAVVGIVAIFAMYFMHSNKAVGIVAAPAASEPAAFDPYALMGTDGNPLIPGGIKPVDVPPRPDNPEALPDDDKGRWWDIEFAGCAVEKVAMPASPGNGPAGKSIILLKAGDHPYWTAYVNGFEKMAKAYGMKTKVFNGNWNVDLQAQQTDQAINERPDMIIFAPVDATACTPLLRRINKAGIPCITSNTIPCDEAMRYCLAWTGPDDWGQMRLLARHFADAMGKEGGYAIVRHMPGSSPFFSRTFAPISELKEYAPNMKMLAMDTSNLEAEGTMRLVSAWLTRFGPELKGLILAGDGFTMTGALEAIKSAGRDDVRVVAAGNSKTGMDSILDGGALAITYQSAESDGALPVHAAAEWFSGRELEPVNYLLKHVITEKDVREFMPAAW